MELLFIAALGYGVYWLFRQNTKSGEETVRAFAYLALRETGLTEYQANAMVADVSKLPDKTIHQTMAIVRIGYGGKQLPLIAEAYSEGMIPRSSWARRRVARAYPFGPPNAASSTRPPGQATAPADNPPSRNDASSTQPAHGTQHSADEGFDAYYGAYVSRLKAKAGIAPTDLHIVELMDDEPLRQAFRDGVPVDRLVEMHAEHWAQRQPRR